MMVSVEAIDAVLPQTQCGECGYPGCLPYAKALAIGQAPIDRCPPGGIAVVKALGSLLDVDPTPYLADAATHTRAPAVAVIREAECIGCTKCIQACPVDAIVGSGKWMHGVISHECTGCGLCVEPCPVDCIELVALAEPAYDKGLARERFHARNTRLAREAQALEQAYRDKRSLVAQTASAQQDKQAKQHYILEALKRASEKKPS